MAQTEVSQSGVTCVPAAALFSGLRKVAASPELGLLWSGAPDSGEEEAEEGEA